MADTESEVNEFSGESSDEEQYNDNQVIRPDLNDSDDNVLGDDSDSDTQAATAKIESWGKKKENYYDAEEEDSDIEQEEEEEARRLAKLKHDRMDAQDFKATRVETDSKDKSKPVDLIMLAKSDLKESEKLEVLNAEAPELLGLLKDYGETFEDLKGKLEMLKDSENDEATPELAEFLKEKSTLLLSYCSNISYYIMLRTKNRNVNDHPVINSLVELKDAIEKYDEIEEKVRDQLSSTAPITGGDDDEGDSDQDGNISDDSSDDDSIHSEELRRHAARFEDEDGDNASDVSSSEEAVGVKSQREKAEMKTTDDRKNISRFRHHKYLGEFEDELTDLKPAGPIKKGKKAKGSQNLAEEEEEDDFEGQFLRDGDMESDDFEDEDGDEWLGRHSGATQNINKFVSKVDNNQKKRDRQAGRPDDRIDSRYQDDLEENQFGDEDLAMGGYEDEGNFVDPMAEKKKKTRRRPEQVPEESEFYKKVLRQQQQQKRQKLEARAGAHIEKRNMINQKRQERLDSKKLEGEEARRGVNYQMLTNKLIVKQSKKEKRNPRVKHRMRHEKMMKKRGTIVREFTEKPKQYGGEGAIRSRVIKSRKLKQ